MYRKALYVSSIKQCFKFEEIRDCFTLAIGAVSSFVLPFDYNPLLIATLGQVDMWITPSVMITLVPLTGKSMYHSSLTLSGTNVGAFSYVPNGSKLHKLMVQGLGHRQSYHVCYQLVRVQ